MKENIETYFDLGLIQWMSYPPKNYDLKETLLQIAKDPDFRAIEITQIKDDQTRLEVKQLLEQSGLRVGYGAQPRLLGPGLNPNALNEVDRLEAEKTLIEAVDEAEYLGAKGIAFLSGQWEEATKDKAYSQLLKTTINVCKYAATKKMMVELEVFDYNMDKKALIGPAPLAAEFAADVRKYCNNFGLIVDLSHFPTTYETSKFVIQTTRPYITHLHIGNAVVKEGCDAYGDQHPRFGFPNSANDVAELTDFFKICKEEGLFNKDEPMILSFEVTPRDHEDADVIVAQTKRTINRAWSLLEE
ncbi:sugar phosphate isomerase/epimerase family protein [Candidatus Enterococcus ikei]|uniref:TIM barrel protein n=1 Tax=Candidatus Enterococcus ikei TaxID=2815326 RepID=A0ABS3GVP6_9ENTE|nr:TIM barrel protein [Enterococcus sp. DIV0869a]MBO0439335.1 TIM barrel protein [Enterococcus sp. DIV0869a]